MQSISNSFRHVMVARSIAFNSFFLSILRCAAAGAYVHHATRVNVVQDNWNARQPGVGEFFILFVFCEDSHQLVSEIARFHVYETEQP